MLASDPFELLQTLSTLLADLGTACDVLSFTDFQHEALRLVQAALPFDSGLWAIGTYGTNGIPAIFSVFLFNQPKEMLSSYERVKQHDKAFARTLAEPGVTMNVAAADVVWDPGSEPMKAHVERYGMSHTLATLTRGPTTELVGSICLYRADPARPFTERDRVLQQALVPHLFALYNRSRIQYLTDLRRPGLERRRRAAAIVDAKGMLHGTSPSFVQLMLLEWPQWHGPMVPQEMFAAIDEPGRSAVFARIVGQATAVNDLLLLNLRETGPCDSLSRREWDVAAAFANGMSHKEVARQLGIAPGTVRNHLSAVYAKLRVNDKAELAKLLMLSPR